MYYKPRVELELAVPKWGARGDTTQDVIWRPRVIASKWTKNNHLIADELTVTIDYNEGGADPRMIKHAGCRMWLWDEMTGPLDEKQHLRFVGICKKAGRKLASEGGGFTVELTFHDYTTFFLMMKPFPSSGMPEWTDTLPEIWRKICDNTGYRDRGNKIKSNVSQLRDRLVALEPEVQALIDTKTLGDLVPGRFHAISKPSPKSRTDAWAVWQYCCASLGFVSQIDRDTCVVTTYSEFIKPDNAARLIYGQNIAAFEEGTDTHVSMKGVLGKSFNTLTGTLMESAYPPPDDPFIKRSRASVKRVAKGQTDPLNEASAEYEEFNFHEIMTQDQLDARVKEAWEEMSRQEMKGKITTSEMRLVTDSTNTVSIDVLDLRAGDCIHVGMDEDARELLKNTIPVEQRVEYLMSRCGYIREVAELVATNIGKRAFASPIFHVEALDVALEWGKFSVDIAYHNTVNLSGVYDDGSSPADPGTEGVVFT